MLIYYPFHAHPADAEEMIQRKLEERDWHEECEDGLWPAEFCLGGSDGTQFRECSDGDQGYFGQAA